MPVYSFSQPSDDDVTWKLVLSQSRRISYVVTATCQRIVTMCRNSCVGVACPQFVATNRSLSTPGGVRKVHASIASWQISRPLNTLRVLLFSPPPSDCNCNCINNPVVRTLTRPCIACKRRTNLFFFHALVEPRVIHI